MLFVSRMWARARLVLTVIQSSSVGFRTTTRSEVYTYFQRSTFSAWRPVNGPNLTVNSREAIIIVTVYKPER